MDPYNQPGHRTERPVQSGPPQGQPRSPPSTGVPPGSTRQPQSISEMEVSTPTLQWVSIDRPRERLSIGADDYVLDSVYNHQMDAWEVLVLIQPREEEDETDDDG